MRTPVLSAGGRINGEGVMHGGADQRTVDHQGPGIEILMQMGVVAAQDFQSANGLRIDLVNRRVSLRGDGAIVAWPAPAVEWLGVHSRRRIGRPGCTHGHYEVRLAKVPN